MLSNITMQCQILNALERKHISNLMLVLFPLFFHFRPFSGFYFFKYSNHLSESIDITK